MHQRGRCALELLLGVSVESKEELHLVGELLLGSDLRKLHLHLGDLRLVGVAVYVCPALYLIQELGLNHGQFVLQLLAGLGRCLRLDVHADVHVVVTVVEI